MFTLEKKKETTFPCRQVCDFICEDLDLVVEMEVLLLADSDVHLP